MPDELGRVLQAELLGSYRAQLLGKQVAYRELLVRAYGADEETLRAALTSKASAERLAAAYVVGERQLPWSADLIERLTDSNTLVRQAARRSLIILSYFALLEEQPGSSGGDDKSAGRPAIADFGPKATADRAAQEESARQWQQWWAERGAAGKPRRSELLAGRSAIAVDAEAARLSAALVFAPPERQADELIRYRDQRGIVYTEAMANALPQLQGDLQRKAREALADRLARMTAATLRDRLSDSRPEVRRAAVLARAAKDDREVVPDLIPSLGDEEESVVRAAKAALKSVAGQDFGPPRNPTAAERAAAVSAWKSWWQKQSSR